MRRRVKAVIARRFRISTCTDLSIYGVTTRFVQNRTPTERAGQQGPSLRVKSRLDPWNSGISSAGAEAGSEYSGF
jgi:hypothetical protein